MSQYSYCVIIIIMHIVKKIHIVKCTLHPDFLKSGCSAVSKVLAMKRSVLSLPGLPNIAIYAYLDDRLRCFCWQL